MIPKTRYAKTPDGGYIAFKVLGEGPPNIAVVGSIATNIEVFFEYEPTARFWLELASFSRLILHDRRGTGLSDDMGFSRVERRASTRTDLRRPAKLQLHRSRDNHRALGNVPGPHHRPDNGSRNRNR
jgi:hypothetical protein